MRRRKGGNANNSLRDEGISEGMRPSTVSAAASGAQPGTFWLTRIVFLRFLAFIYCKNKKKLNLVYTSMYSTSKTESRDSDGIIDNIKHT